MKQIRPIRDTVRWLRGNHDERIASERVLAENPPRPITEAQIADALEWNANVSGGEDR